MPLPTIPNHSHISHLMFLFLFHHFSHTTLLLFHIHSYHPSDILQPLSIFLFLLHIKCIKITHVSLFPQVHKHTYNHRTSMSSFPSPLRANIIPLPSVLLLHQHIHLQNFNLFDIFYSYILFLPFCVIESIFPCSPTTLLYSLTDIPLPSVSINMLHMCLHLEHHIDLHPISIQHAQQIYDTKFS